MPEPRPSAPLAGSLDDAARARDLTRMKRLATGLFLGAAVVFLACVLLGQDAGAWVGYVRATAEASMVGALADWFAVTALFRHPLGIPIPHTAIIPEKKDQVGRTLGGFIQKNFLARDVIATRLRALRIAERLALWLREPENARTIARQTANAIAKALPLLDDEDVQRMIDGTVASRIRNTEVAPLLGKLLSLVTAGDRHQELLDEAIRLAARGVTENHDLIRDRIAAESPWWIPTRVDDKIHEKVVGSIERTLHDIRDDEGHPLRIRFDHALHEFIDRLQSDPAVIARAEQIKNDTLNDDAVRRFSLSLWADTKEALLRYAERTATPGEPGNPGALERGLTSVGEALLADAHLLARADDAIVEAALAVIEKHQDEVGALISSTVAAWDPEVTSKRIELAIGRDLQFIRINGTVVGGLVGLALYTISRFMN